MQVYARKAFTLPQIKQELSNADSEFYFALVENEIAGYIKLNFNNSQTEFQDSEAMEIERIYILQNYQGKRIGGELLDFASQTAKLKSMKYIWLGVWEHNTNAIRFYQKNGFTIFSSHQFILGNDEQTDLLMRKQLEA
nr:GNAT family N-acetyltransferase [Mucilaginibacter segetis]